MNDWRKNLKAWASKNSKLVLFFVGATILIIASKCAAAELRGHIIKDDEMWWLFYQDGKIIKCLANPGEPTVKCDINGLPVECENLSPNSGYIGECK
jgi:hypothetical protein